MPSRVDMQRTIREILDSMMTGETKKILVTEYNNLIQTGKAAKGKRKLGLLYIALFYSSRRSANAVCPRRLARSAGVEFLKFVDLNFFPLTRPLSNNAASEDPLEAAS